MVAMLTSAPASRLETWEGLPARFAPWFDDWKREEMPGGRLVYVPQVNVWQVASPEYAIGVFHRRVRLVQNYRLGGMQVHAFSSADVLRVELQTALLKTVCTVWYASGEAIHKASFRFNRVTEEYFYFLYNVLFSTPWNDQNVECHPLLQQAEIRRYSYGLSNYACLALRMGRGIERFFCSTGKARQGPASAKTPAAHLVAQTESGLVCITLAGATVRAAYLLPQAGAVVRLEGDRACALCITDRCGQTLRIPVQSAARAEAQQWAGLLHAQ